ncbi:MAG: hypothetical protein K2F59_02285, partial [Eubacteriales bacterium]|nr:hypothetical protein [Eubacteriales bacterium]
MKKTILLMLSVLFILAGCSNKNSNDNNETTEVNETNETDTNFSKSNEINKKSSETLKSLNGFLEYELPEGWENRGGDKVKTEISIENSDIMLLVDYVEYSTYEPKEFTKYQQDVTKPEEANFTLAKEDTFEDNGRKINLTIYEKQNSSDKKSQVLLATVEFDENKEAFLGVSATITENKNGINEVFDILNTVKFTGLKLSEERKFVAEKEDIE